MSYWLPTYDLVNMNYKNIFKQEFINLNDIAHFLCVSSQRITQS